MYAMLDYIEMPPREDRGIITQEKCNQHCQHLTSCQEVYDDEPMGFCALHPSGRKFIDAMDELCCGNCECVAKGLRVK
jgi:hypothetical protein